MNILAQAAVPLGPIGGEGLGPFGKNPGDGVTGIAKIVSSVIGLMTIAAGIWFLFQFITGGISWISAGGDKSKLQGARDRLTNSFLGLVVVVAGWAILALASTFFGVDFTLSTDALLRQLAPQ